MEELGVLGETDCDEGGYTSEVACNVIRGHLTSFGVTLEIFYLFWKLYKIVLTGFVTFVGRKQSFYGTLSCPIWIMGAIYGRNTFCNLPGKKKNAHEKPTRKIPIKDEF